MGLSKCAGLTYHRNLTRPGWARGLGSGPGLAGLGLAKRISPSAVLPGATILVFATVTRGRGRIELLA